MFAGIGVAYATTSFQILFYLTYTDRCTVASTLCHRLQTFSLWCSASDHSLHDFCMWGLVIVTWFFYGEQRSSASRVYDRCVYKLVLYFPPLIIELCKPNTLIKELNNEDVITLLACVVSSAHNWLLYYACIVEWGQLCMSQFCVTSEAINNHCSYL